MTWPMLLMKSSFVGLYMNCFWILLYPFWLVSSFKLHYLIAGQVFAEGSFFSAWDSTSWFYAGWLIIYLICVISWNLNYSILIFEILFCADRWFSKCWESWGLVWLSPDDQKQEAGLWWAWKCCCSQQRGSAFCCYWYGHAPISQRFYMLI